MTFNAPPTLAVVEHGPGQLDRTARADPTFALIRRALPRSQSEWCRLHSRSETQFDRSAASIMALVVLGWLLAV